MSSFEPRASPTPETCEKQPEPPSLLGVREFEVSLSFVVLSDPQSTWNTKAKSQKGEAAYLLTSFFAGPDVGLCALLVPRHWGKRADLTPPPVTSLASPHRPLASDGSLEPSRREYL